MNTDKHFGYCTLCRSRCGTINRLENGKFVAVSPDITHPTGAAICAKGRAAPELVYSDQRILTPLKRTNPKSSTDPGWVEISWEEAFSEVTNILTQVKNEYGAEGMAFASSSPSATPIVDELDWIKRFIYNYGSPNLCTATEICNWFRDDLFALTFGTSLPIPDYANADLILLWGHNPTNTWLSMANQIALGKANGAQSIVIDPRTTPLAQQATLHLQPTPGSDLMLALGILNVLLQSHRYDSGFVKAWSNAVFLVREDTGKLLRVRDLAGSFVGGNLDDYLVWDSNKGGVRCYNPENDYSAVVENFALFGEFSLLIAGEEVKCRTVFDLFREHLKDYTPEIVAMSTGITPSQLERMASLIFQSKATAFYFWSGLAQSNYASDTGRALAILYALTGSYDKFGGNVVFSQPAVRLINDINLLGSTQLAKALGANLRPLGPAATAQVTARELYGAILEKSPYPVVGLMSFGSNLLLTRADPELGMRALQNLKYYIACDLFHNPSSQYADIILPLNTPWERDGLKVGFDITQEAASLIQYRPQLVANRGGKSEAEIVFELAQRLGFDDPAFKRQVHERFDYILEPLGLSRADLKTLPRGMNLALSNSERKYAQQTSEKKVIGFNTSSRRVELYSEKLLSFGYSPFPAAREQKKQVSYPLIMTTYKSGYFCHSQQRQVSSLRKKHLYPTVEISLQVAQHKKIMNGDQVVVHNDNGSAQFIAKINDTLNENILVGDYGWWQACADLGQPGYQIDGSNSSNYAQLIDPTDCDSISGSLSHKAIVCDLRKISQSAKWDGFADFKLTNKQRITSNVVQLSFRRCGDLTLLPTYLPGSHITLKALIDGNPIIRSYSLIGNATNHLREYTIAVKEDGIMSNYLCNDLQLNDSLGIMIPSGKFSFPRQANFPVILIASGIGITPFISYLRTISEQELPPEVILYYLNDDGNHHAFKDELAALEKKLAKFTLINYYARPLADEIGNYVSGLFSVNDIPHQYVERNARFYMCCSERLINQFEQALKLRGIHSFRIFHEVFTTSSVNMTIDENAKFEIEFKRINKKLTWSAADGTLLEFGLRNDIQMPSGCRVGQCESCIVNIVEGQVIHKIPTELEASRCLVCQAIPASNLVLDI